MLCRAVRTAHRARSGEPASKLHQPLDEPPDRRLSAIGVAAQAKHLDYMHLSAITYMISGIRLFKYFEAHPRESLLPHARGTRAKTGR